MMMDVTENLELWQGLGELGRRLAEHRALDSLLVYAMTVALELFEGEYGYVILVDKQGNVDFRVKQDRFGHEWDDPIEQISTTIFKEVTRTRASVVVTDASHDGQWGDFESVRALRLQSIVCVPLISFGHLLGAIYLENRNKAGVFTTEHLGPLQAFAAQMATVMDNVILRQQVQTLQAELGAHTSWSEFMTKRPKALPNAFAISAQQQRILTLVAQGLTYQHVARQMQVGESTIKYHMKQIVAKLGVKNRRQAIQWWMRQLEKADKEAAAA